MEVMISEKQLKSITEQYLGQAPKKVENPFDFGKILRTINNVSAQCTDLIKKYEEFKEKEYIDDAGKLSIGYGTRLKYHPELKNKKINNEVATAYLKKVLDSEVVPSIKRNIKIPLNQNQMNAVASLVYNIGITKFANSKLLKAINSKNINEIIKNWQEFRLGGGDILGGLVNRRAEEIKLFFSK
jgi:lysozyme